MSILVGRDLAKSYGANDVFAGVDVRVELGDRIGLVGPNGCGKTSLLRILAGLEPHSGGDIQVARGVRTGYLPQDAPPAGDQTLFSDLLSVFGDLLAQREELRVLEQRMTDPDCGAEEMTQVLAEYGQQQEAFEQAGGYTLEQRVKQVLSGLGLETALWHEPLAHLSGGQRTRALLGRLLLEEPDLLMLDEPTNHLDVQSVEWLEQRLLNWHGSLVVVSHDRYFLDTVAIRIWDLAHQRLETYRGNYTHYRQQREERLARWQIEYEKQQKHVRETQEFVRRYKAGQRTKEAQGRETRLQRFLEEEALPPPPTTQRIRLPLRTDKRSGDLVLRTRRLVAGYLGPDDAQGQNGVEGTRRQDAGPLRYPVPILEVPDLDLNRGQRVALIGPNGAGKTTLIRTILGELQPVAGTLHLGAGVELGYLAQRHVGAGFGLMVKDQSVLDALLEVRNLPLEQARTYLGQFLFHGDDVFKAIDQLSGGQRSRIALARLTLQGANFLLLDEPTNHLDLDSQEILQDAVRQFSGTVLLVTHDRALVDALATQLWMVEPGENGEPGTLQIFEGTWKQWLQERARLAESGESQMPEASSLTDAQDHRERQREERRRRREAERQAGMMADIEEEIQRMERQLAALEDKMARASLAQNLEEVNRYHSEHQTLLQQLEEHMEQWTALAEAS